MSVITLLLANGFFLVILLVVLLAILSRNDHSVPHGSKKVKEDIKKIKQQIAAPEGE